ncbi:ROK family transcriptional regulator [Bhargavaea cecembensis]|uniref:ROK family transcriptional regulator n=1 Tax=Bhargavaea cecembensis TaxID=394098 RepID=UPI00058B0FB8|nr:ROK family transcriptional regulator [Bhargavaea cecembensis]
MRQIQTGNQAMVKTINKSIVLDLIIQNGPISRADISKETGLNRATVSTMVAELIEDSFVFEIGEGKSSGGRKPVMLYFNERAGFAVGIDLGVNYLLGVLTDLNGAVVEEISVPLSDREEERVMEELEVMVRKLIGRAPESPYGVVGIGVGVPGIVDREGKILFAPNLGWRDVELKPRLERTFGVPVQIINEANAGANGECLYGAGKLAADQVYISIGIGIGAGIIIDGQLYSGKTGIAGEVGHMTIQATGERCRCGNYGCWELYASEKALLGEVGEGESGVSGVSDSAGDGAGGVPGERVAAEEGDRLEAILARAKAGDPHILKALEKVGASIGIGLISIIHAFNPDTLIIGNRLARFGEWLREPIDRVLEERLATHQGETPEIQFSLLGRDSCAVGAAAFRITGFLEKLGAE